jgi:hypothetical protein
MAENNRSEAEEPRLTHAHWKADQDRESDSKPMDVLEIKTTLD